MPRLGNGCCQTLVSDLMSSISGSDASCQVQLAISWFRHGCQLCCKHNNPLTTKLEYLPNFTQKQGLCKRQCIDFSICNFYLFDFIVLPIIMYAQWSCELQFVEVCWNSDIMGSCWIFEFPNMEIHVLPSHHIELEVTEFPLATSSHPLQWPLPTPWWMVSLPWQTVSSLLKDGFLPPSTHGQSHRQPPLYLDGWPPPSLKGQPLASFLPPLTDRQPPSMNSLWPPLTNCLLSQQTSLDKCLFPQQAVSSLRWWMAYSFNEWPLPSINGLFPQWMASSLNEWPLPSMNGLLPPSTNGPPLMNSLLPLDEWSPWISILLPVC